MALDRNRPDDNPTNRQTEEPASKDAETTPLRSDERPRTAIMTDANRLTAAELRFLRNKSLDESEAKTTESTEAEADHQDPEQRDGQTDQDAQRPAAKRGVSDTSLRPDKRDNHDEEPDASCASASDRPRTALMTDANGLTAAELRFQRNKRIDELGDRRSATFSKTEPDAVTDPGLHDRLHDAETSESLDRGGLTSQVRHDTAGKESSEEPTPSKELTKQPGADGQLAHDSREPAADTVLNDQSPIAEGHNGRIDAMSGTDQILRIDREHKVDNVEVATDYYTNVPPTNSDRYLVRDKDNPIPLFDGAPARDQARQGNFGDCGIVSTFGAIAGHRPDAIVNAIHQTGDGAFEVRLHVVAPASKRDPVARPTGDTVTYRITDELPVRIDDPTRPLAGIKADTCGWAPLMEKAIASQDQVWNSQQQADWDATWKARDKPAVDAERAAMGLSPSPDEAPTGYSRLDVGSTATQQANLIAEITGSEAEVRTMPDGPQAERQLLGEFKDQLADNKPILVGTRGPNSGYETAPFSPRTFAFGHAFEVTKVENGHIHVRNPWGDNRNPPPMPVSTFMEYFRSYDPNSSRRLGEYATLK